MSRIVTDPYAGNILVAPLGPILSREQVLARLTQIPSIPKGVAEIPRHVRMHFLIQMQDLHLPTHEGWRVHESMDLIIRPSYRHRDPALPATWGMVSGEALPRNPRAAAQASLSEGHSGTGKTQAILRSLCCYPAQVVLHPTFPGMAKEHVQVVWLSADVPASGRAADLAMNLMRAYDTALEMHLPGYVPRFTTTLERVKRDGARLLDEWRQVAVSSFLGLLHLDEIQNFFRLQSLDARRRRKSPTGEVAELSIIEDQCLKFLLTFTNTWQIGLALSGTPDGVSALTRRLANTQRFVTGGYHSFSPMSLDDQYYVNLLFPTLFKYQYVKVPIKDPVPLRELVIELSGGIRRIVIALWVAAHRIAFERKSDELRLDDFRKAAATYLAPFAPAIEALRSGDPVKMARYEDLVPRDTTFWSSFWEAMGQQG